MKADSSVTLLEISTLSNKVSYETLSYLDNNNVLYLNQPELKIMLETASQLDELKGQFPPGTQFFLPGSQENWQLGADGEPVKNEIPGTFYIDPETMNLYYSSEGE